MNLWGTWWEIFQGLRPAFNRQNTFLWFAICVMGMTIRNELAGVTSIIRAVGLKESCYERLLGCFHSKAINLNRLHEQWVQLLIQYCADFLFRVEGRLVLIGDGIKVPKSGKKMPGVKKLHQESESNTKPEYIFGHSCQAIGIVAGKLSTLFSIPMICQIHEGVVFSNRDKRTLITKMMTMLSSLQIKQSFYFVADAYYANRIAVMAILKSGKDHLISRVRSNAVAYQIFENDNQIKRGRKRKYGNKVRLKSLFEFSGFTAAPSPLFGEENTTIQYHFMDLLWRPIGIPVRFVAVIHPVKGRLILMSTDISLNPLAIIRLYSVRFKIEVSFKQAIHTLGMYAYRFWMKTMKPRSKSSGNQHLHKETEAYRIAVRRKLHAYHVHLMAGVIAQGLTNIISIIRHDQVWSSFGSWLRTIRPNTLPSEQVVCSSLYYGFSQFLKDYVSISILAKFIHNNIDTAREETKRLVA